MLKIDKFILLSIANHFTLCLSIIILGFLFRMVSVDSLNNITEMQHGRIFLEKRQPER
jgi:hypothetical protein